MAEVRRKNKYQRVNVKGFLGLPLESWWCHFSFLNVISILSQNGRENFSSTMSVIRLSLCQTIIVIHKPYLNVSPKFLFFIYWLCLVNYHGQLSCLMTLPFGDTSRNVALVSHWSWGVCNMVHLIPRVESLNGFTKYVCYQLSSFLYLFFKNFQLILPFLLHSRAIWIRVAGDFSYNHIKSFGFACVGRVYAYLIVFPVTQTSQ